MTKFKITLPTLLLALMAVIAIGCGDDDNPMNSVTSDVTGEWTGQMVSDYSSAFGNGGIRLTLDQTGDAVTGSFRLGYKVSPSRSYSTGGSVTGQRAGDTLSLVLINSGDDVCTTLVTMDIASGTMSGMHANACNGSSGTISVSK